MGSKPTPPDATLPAWSYLGSPVVLLWNCALNTWSVIASRRSDTPDGTAPAEYVVRLRRSEEARERREVVQIAPHDGCGVLFEYGHVPSGGGAIHLDRYPLSTPDMGGRPVSSSRPAPTDGTNCCSGPRLRLWF